MTPLSALTEQLLVRAIVSLCALADAADDLDLRDQVHDSVTVVVRLSLAGGQADQLQSWGQDTLRLVEQSPLQAHPSAARTQVTVLRLLKSLGPVSPQVTPPKRAVPVPVKRKHPLTDNQKKVIAVVQEHAPVRTQEVVQALSGILSERSVHRTLKELATGKHISRTQDLGSVRYEIPAPEKALTA